MRELDNSAARWFARVDNGAVVRRAVVRHACLGFLCAAPFLIWVGGAWQIDSGTATVAAISFVFGLVPALIWRRGTAYRVVMTIAATLLTIWSGVLVLAWGFGLLLLPAVFSAWTLRARPPTRW